MFAESGNASVRCCLYIARLFVVDINGVSLIICGAREFHNWVVFNLVYMHLNGLKKGVYVHARTAQEFSIYKWHPEAGDIL